MTKPDELTPVCPYARKVEGSTPGLGGVICGVMENDAKRADPILEGAPIGVFISAGDDPSTLANLCCGKGEPVLSPDDLPARPFGYGHYSACPVYAAGKEISEAERAFAPAAPEEPTWGDGLELTEREKRELGLGV